MNTDFRISVTLTRHPKIRRLIRRLGQSAFFNLVQLWTFTAVYKPKGCFADMTPEEIEEAAEWQGEPMTFYQTLLDLRLLDVDRDGTVSIHDWAAHNSWASNVQERSDRARQSSKARWDKRNDAQIGNEHDAQTGNEHDAQTGNEHDAQTGNEHDAPSPSPSPSPNEKGPECSERLPVGNPSEPTTAPPTPGSPPMGISIPLVDGTEYAVTEADVAQWQDAYPGINVPDTLRRIRAWCDANPKRRKTRKGVRRCINSWLASDQDKLDRGSVRASPFGNRPQYPQPMTARQRYMHELGEALVPTEEEPQHDNPINITPPHGRLELAVRPVATTRYAAP